MRAREREREEKEFVFDLRYEWDAWEFYDVTSKKENAEGPPSERGNVTKGKKTHTEINAQLGKKEISSAETINAHRYNVKTLPPCVIQLICAGAPHTPLPSVTLTSWPCEPNDTSDAQCVRQYDIDCR